MKRLLFVLITTLTLAAPLTFVAAGQVDAAYVLGGCSGSGSSKTSAQNQNTPDVCSDAQNQGTKSDPIITIIKAAIDVLSFIIGIGAIITLVVSGVRIILSAGDSQAVASARTGLIYALAGLAVVALSQALVAFVLDKVQ